MENRKVTLVCIILFMFLNCVICTLSKSDRDKKKSKEKRQPVNDKLVPPDKPQVNAARETTKGDISSATIVSNHALFNKNQQERKNFFGETLAYVTPWNNHGYDVAKWFSRKFTYVSPVWLQIRPDHRNSYSIHGSHDIDKQWVQNVTSNGITKMVPRVLFDGWHYKHFTQLFSSENLMEDCIDTILSFIKKHKFSGATIEIWSQLGGKHSKELIHFLRHMAETFHVHNKMIILVIPPPIYAQNQPGMFGAAEFESLVDVIDRFSLMTYDYSTSRPGPNSPIAWVQNCVDILVPDDSSKDRHKILVGLNFYGVDYTETGSRDAILGHQYVKLLKTYKPSIKWNDEYREHIFHYISESTNHFVFYPSLSSIQTRLDLAKQMNVGISIWEIGQGLDYFYDLF